MRHSVSLPISDSSQVGDARRTTARLTAELALSEKERGIAALVVTELGNNLVKYGKDGQLVLRPLHGLNGAGIEVLSLDSGPGIAEPERWLTDGYSTGGTPGNGLGAVKRASRQFDIYSAPALGTVIMSRVISASKGKSYGRSPFETGVVCVAMPGETECGDSWATCETEERAVFMVVDGLGHGAIAATAADAAVQTFERCCDLSSLEIVSRTDMALRSTRGAVMAVAEVKIGDRTLSFTGIGNIAASLSDGATSQHMISMNGTLGLTAKPRSYQYSWPADNVMILSSDGLRTRWQLDQFPGLKNRHPSLIAGMLYQSHYRGRDDVTVFAARWKTT